MNRWADLLDRGRTVGATGDEVRAALETRRAEEAGSDAGDGGDRAAVGATVDPSPARVVADADVLAADLLVGGASGSALDHLREHSWTTLVASDRLLEDATAVVRTLADAELAADWRERVDRWRAPASHPPGDHPALASAYDGGAMHVLTLDPDLSTAGANATLRDRVETTVRHPAAFVRLFDPASLYGHVVGGTYPGPDRDPRA